MSLQRVQEETTSSEFVDWKMYLVLREEQKFFVYEKEDYYLAQIAAEMRRTFAKHPRRIKLKDFILQFKRKKEKKKKKMSVKERTKEMKAWWGAVLSRKGS